MNIEKIVRRSLFSVAVAGLLSVGAWAPSASASTPAPTDTQSDRRDVRHDVRDRNADNRDIRHDRARLRECNENNGANSAKCRAIRHDIHKDRRDRNRDTRDIHHDQRDIRHDGGF
jgi:hypothetical protein